MVLIPQINYVHLRRCLHATLGRLSSVPMSQHEPNTRLPYEKLATNLEIVKKRHFYNFQFFFIFY